MRAIADSFDKTAHNAAAPAPTPAPAAAEVVLPGKKAKKIRDPEEPKRPSTAFFLYSQAARKEVQENEGIKGKDVAVRLGEQWTALPEEEKKVRFC